MPTIGALSLMAAVEPGRASVGQGVYRLEHPALGPMILLLVPGKRDGSGSAHVATINRL